MLLDVGIIIASNIALYQVRVTEYLPTCRIWGRGAEVFEKLFAWMSID